MILKKTDLITHDPELVGQLNELSRTGYIDNTALMAREIVHCSEIYLLYTDLEDLVAFFMVNYENLDDLDTCYLGLSYCHSDHQGLGYSAELYKAFFIDCRKKELESGRRILCWWTTASPIPFHWFSKNIDQCEPSTEGFVSETGAELIAKIAKDKYDHTETDPLAPFILRGVASHTSYSENERLRLALIQK